MTRLQSELRRLYLPQASSGQDTAADAASLVDDGGRVRAMVLELARPADWAALSTVWAGVHTDQAFPAPAIAVSGKDGYQLWFSLAQPLPAAQATAFLDALRVRYLGDIRPQRIGLWPRLDAAALQPTPLSTPPSTPPTLHASLVPAVQAGTGLWSAFIAPDLAAAFADEPWLDLPPNRDGQCNLLARLKSISADDLAVALGRLQPAAVLAPAQPAAAAGPQAGPGLDPKRFLLDIMNNPGVALGLRIEAAKALLPYTHAPQRL